MRGIIKVTRQYHEYYEKNPGMAVSYWGSIRTWAEGCRVLATNLLELCYLNGDLRKQDMLIARMKWLWDREHFLEGEESKTLEAFYDATFKEVARRISSIVEDLKLL